jgi:hypothetical protein
LNKRIYSHEASEARSIVCTIAAGIVRTIIQPDPKTAQLSGQKFYGLFEQKKNHKAVSMVITLTQGLTLTILQAQSTWERAQLSRQKLSASPRQIYDAHPKRAQ